MEVRKLYEEDIETVCRHREDMFRDAGRAEDVLRPMTKHFREWLRPRLSDGSYFGFIACQDDGEPIAGIGLMLIDWPPHPSHPITDKRGYVLNVFVEPEYRGRGIARHLMHLAHAEFSRLGVQLAILHSTAKGRRMYADLGWQGTTEMSKSVVVAAD
jgi:GNAT superfamily N-acetyltransferase